MRISWLMSGSLAVLFFLLSIKGQQDVGLLQDWEIVNLPAFALWLKASANQFGAIFLAVVTVISIRRRISFALSAAALIQTIALLWYYLRSAFVGSGNPLNYAASVLLGAWLYVVSTSQNNSTKEVFERGLLYFSFLHVTATLSLTLLGYGYAIGGSANRLYGLAYHPNMLGAVSSLAFAVFLFNTYAVPETNHYPTKRYVFFSLSLGALILVVLSGSRTAILMSLIPVVFLVPMRALIALSGIGVVLLLGAGLLLITSPDTPWGAAITRMLEAPLDNRYGVWQALIDDFYAYPLWGAGDRSGVSASSYLTAFSGTGLLGGPLFIAMMLSVTFVAARRLIIFRLGQTPQIKISLYEFIFLQISVGSLFEAYMFDKFGLLQLLSILATNKISKKFKSK